MKKLNIYFLLFVFGMILNACTYDFIAKEELPPVDQTVDILFATQIAPIFASKCISCHKVGGQSPDLSAANAYNNIKSMNLLGATPDASLIFTYPNPATTMHTWMKYSATEAQLVSTWITQGAKNN